MESNSVCNQTGRREPDLLFTITITDRIGRPDVLLPINPNPNPNPDPNPNPNCPITMSDYNFGD